MNKADFYLRETLKEILENGVWDENPRPVWEDGTKAHSKYVTQKTLEFDITKGEFPISTLRNGSLKSAFNELKTIYIDQSNKEEDFIKNGIHWWGSWMNSDGDLGTAYSYNLESLHETNDQLIPVKKREGVPDLIILPPDFEQVYAKTKHKNANKVIESKYVDYRILDKTSSYKKTIQLLDCGLITEIGTSKNFVSPFSKTIGGCFYKGFYNEKQYDEHTLKVLISMWKNIADRITGNGANNSKYDLKNITPRWLSLQGFLEDIIHVPQFFLAKRDKFKGWALDKDYYGASYYSKDTCVFLKSKDNLKYRDTQKIYKADGKYFDSTLSLSKHLGVTDKNVRYLLEEEKNNTLRKRDEKTINLRSRFEVISEDGFVYRKPISKNQVTTLLENIERDKFSRRHMLSFFNWKDQDKKQLMECAFQNLFSVRNIDGINYLDQTLTQRSSDFIVAGMINCSQYVMLNMIICNHLKYKTGEDWRPGKFVWFVQNLHIYDRHQWASKEILNKEPVDIQPMIELDCPPKDFFQHTWEDFNVSGTEGIKPLSKKLEIAI